MQKDDIGTPDGRLTSAPGRRTFVLVAAAAGVLLAVSFLYQSYQEIALVTLGIYLLITLVLMYRSNRQLAGEQMAAPGQDLIVSSATGFLQAALDACPEGEILLDTDRRVVAFNALADEYVRKINGQPLLKNEPLDELLREAARPAFLGHFSRALLDGVLRVEKKRIGFNDTDRWFEIQYRPISNDSASPTGVAIRIRDITESDTANQVSRDEAIQRMIDSLPLPVYFKDRDLRYRGCNRAFEDYLGLLRNGILGKAVWDITPERFAARYDDDDKRLLTAGGARNFTFKIRRADGAVRDVIFHKAVLYGDGGDIDGLVGIITDVTELEQARKEVDRTERMLRSFIENTPAAVAMFDTDMRYIAHSRRWLTDYRLTEQNIIGKTHYEVFPEIPERWKETHQRCLEGEPASCDEDEFPRLDGRTDWVKWEIMPWRRTDGTVGGIIMMTEVITERKEAVEKLRKAHADYELIFNSVPSMIWYKDTNNNIIRVNQTAADAYGMPRSEIEGRSSFELWPEEADRYFADDREVIRTRRPKSGLIETVRSDGELTIVVRTTKVPLFGLDGSVTGIVALSENISDVREVKEALQRSEDRYRHLFETAPLGIMSITGDGYVTSVNPALLKLVGAPATSNEKELTIDHFEPLRQLGMERDFQHCIRAGKSVSNEGEVITEWGARSSLRYLLTPLWHDDGKPAGVQAVVEDVTVRTRTERELKKLTTAVNQSANAICITDPDGVAVYVNPRFSKITGYSLMEIVGEPVSILKSGRHGADFYARMWERIAHGETWSGEVQNRRKNGELYWERKTISPVMGEDGTIINYISIGEDITAETQARQKLAASEKMAAVGMLAAGVSHEFKNYLAGIIGNASFALEHLAPEQSHERDVLTKILEISERANQVAMSLLTYSKDSDQEKRPEDLRRIIDNTISLVAAELRTRSIEIRTDIQDVPHIPVSASKIQQLLLNLIINAEHAIGRDGTISISLREESELVMLAVSDTGTGIQEKDLERIFEPFVSTKGVWGRDPLAGAGMGLAICRNIAEEHDGDLTVQSEPGKGSTFTLSLPVRAVTPKSGSVGRRPAGPIRLLLVSTNDEILSRYSGQADVDEVLVTPVNSLQDIMTLGPETVDLIVCDARFVAKVELVQIVDMCRAGSLSYVMINCGAMEYQLSDLFDGALTNFRGLPQIRDIIAADPRIRRATNKPKA